MAKEYSLKAFLLGIDDYSLIERYFNDRKIGGFSYTKDNKKKKNDVIEEITEKIEEILRKQPEQIQQEIERDFVAKKLHPLDLKNAFAEELNKMLEIFRKNGEKLEKLAKAAYTK